MLNPIVSYASRAIFSICIVFVLAWPAIAASAPSAQTAEEQENEMEDEWEKIKSSKECKDEYSAACENMKLPYYCKYARGTSYGATMCAGSMREAVDKKMNEKYRHTLQLLQRLDNDPKLRAANKLIEAQQAWEIFREKECTLISEQYRGGTLMSALYEECMQEEAELRIKQLDKIIKGF